MACRIILASQSPRRKDLLQQVGLDFSIQIANINETPLLNEKVEQYIQRIAMAKAQTIAKQQPDAIVIAADTTVTVDSEILGKPEHQQHALYMWQKLSGRLHQVKTTIVIAYASQCWHDTVTTDILFKDLTDEEMLAYWQTGEPLDKAGGYAIQGRAAAWVKRMEGSYSNVVGLPLFETLQLLKQAQFCASKSV
ncbi:septum formation inhibitor Maf [Acinetobacter qingfengensis]|uniref:dTTP/UTP pyrophosphatase n=1 Tax=Acinetobacter qingfengensis TaxID=1262585 RepID=A0A1E7RG84_9GAMM|nr:Maf family protein [Acinetobacter qingfengensis]KAA8732711.1 septum formation inhibitor Maf [Acinetobacter qingfengensis]OEY98175.1 septum formation protein Maf [Acinetobacter qingfengensis]